VKLVFRDYPIVQIHPEALLAAEAVDCAGEQEQVLEYHDQGIPRAVHKGDDLVRFKAPI